MVIGNRAVLFGITIGALVLSSNAFATNLPFSPPSITTLINESLNGTKASTFDLGRNLRRLELEREASRKRHINVPQQHINYCMSLVSDYRQSDNTIAYDRYTRIQCFSRYYKPY